MTKRQLCGMLDRSPRWVEMRVAAGMPVLEATDRYGGRRYDVDAVKAWLAAGEAPAQSTLEARVRTLEQQVAQLMSAREKDT